MKLRLDLLEYLQPEDIMEEALANNHRYQAEPLFSKTGVGSLLPATAEDRARELRSGQELIAKLLLRQKQAEKNGET